MTVVRHATFNYYSKLAAEFLQFSNHQVRVVVTGKRVNRGVGFVLEIPVDYIFCGDSRVITWFKEALEKLDQSLNVKVEICVK